MKTKTLYVAALLIAGALSSCQKDAVEPSASAAGTIKTTGTESQVATMVTVHYQVTISQSISAPICGTYLVEVTNSAGQVIDKPQRYIKEQRNYFFTEKTASGITVRVARLINTASEGDLSFCPNVLNTQPDKETVNLKTDKAYFFNLYPTYQKSANPH
jgi:hypothetical protein